jgi:PadR family transcriptional regulator, regulatory protein PadR
MADMPPGTGTALRRGVIEFCVLAVLERGECYAVELVRVLSDTLGMATSEGTIYPLLSRLRTAEKINAVWRGSPSGPPRRYYSLTPLGRVYLNAFRSEWATFRDGVDTLLKGE